MSPEISVSILLSLSTIGLILYGKRQQKTDSYLGPVMLFILYLALLWMPLDWRNWMIALFISLMGFALGSFWGGVLVAVAILVASSIIPGGASVLLLFLSALIMFMWTHEGVTQLRRIARARSLEPGKVPKGEVELGGRVEALLSIQPIPEIKCAMWWLHCGEMKHQSKAPLLLRSDGMNAIVEPMGASLGKVESKMLDAKELKDLMESHQLTPFEMKPEERATLHWIEEGKEAYVIGFPEWESRIETEGQYRDMAMTPVFRSRENHPVYLANQSLHEIHRGARWHVALGIGMFMECALVIGAQLLIG